MLTAGLNEKERVREQARIPLLVTQRDQLTQESALMRSPPWWAVPPNCDPDQIFPPFIRVCHVFHDRNASNSCLSVLGFGSPPLLTSV